MSRVDTRGVPKPKLVLTYFDFDGSRGEVAHLVVNLTGIAFEDKWTK